jgi:4-amino-4-deoxy-L-arabinose transferase-like glycosyltransferase
MQSIIHIIQQTSHRKKLGVLLIVFMVVQIILYLQIGVFAGLEAEKYTREGSLLAQHGHLSDSKFLFYLPVILLVAFCKLTSLPLVFVVLVQVALAGLALVCFYRFSLVLTNNFCAFTAGLLLAAFTPLQMWNCYLYSDSVFISLSIIFLYALQRWQNSGTRGLLYIGVLLLLLCFSRPMGLLYIPPVIIYLLFKKTYNRKHQLSRMAIALLLPAGMLFLVNAIFSGGGDMDALKPFIEEHIICFVPNNAQGAAVDVVHTASPLNDLLYYVSHNPAHFMKLMMQKLVSFFNLTRPHYSTLHNAVMIAVMMPLYVFLIPGLINLVRRRLNIMIFIISLLVLYPVGITFQCDDWHSRFTMAVMPILILASVVGFYNTMLKKKFEHIA